MDFKYKIADVAKEFGVPTKKVIETVAPITGESCKTGSAFGEKELNLLLETLTREESRGQPGCLPGQRRQGRPAPAPKAPVENKKPAAEAKKPEQKPARRPRKRSPKPRMRKRKSRRARRTARPRTSLPRSAAKSALPCRSWPPTPASRSPSRLWSRCRSTVPRCLLTPAPST